MGGVRAEKDGWGGSVLDDMGGSGLKEMRGSVLDDMGGSGLKEMEGSVLEEMGIRAG